MFTTVTLYDSGYFSVGDQISINGGAPMRVLKVYSASLTLRTLWFYERWWSYLVYWQEKVGRGFVRRWQNQQ